MAILSTKTKVRSFTTYRMDEFTLEQHLSLIVPNSETEVISNESLSRPVLQLKENIIQIYKHLYNKGINV